MDPITLLPFRAPAPEPLDRDLAEIDAAIELVAPVLATRVRLVGLAPTTESLAAVGLARCAGRRGRGSRSIEARAGRSTMTLGPRADRAG